MHVERIPDPAFWSALVPELRISVDGGKWADSPWQLSWNPETRGVLVEDGYLQFESVIPDKTTRVLRNGIVALQRQAIPPVFAFVYDEYWEFFYRLEGLLRHVLGNGPRMLPDFWIWYVDPQREEAGWGPHRDKTCDTLLPDGMPKSVTVWAALSDATPLNGCMYVVPASRDSGYRDFSHENVHAMDPQSVRALGVPMGSLLVWNQRIVHWGGRSSKRAAGPRISMAFEFQRGDIPPYNQPLLELSHFPSFDTRIRMIGKQILQYTHMYKYSDDLVALARTVTGAADKDSMR
jgi:hypothetical protein